MGNPKHLELARFFIEHRGNNTGENADKQIVAHLPVREMTTAEGHSVRAGYLYTAMAMLTKLDGDPSLKATCLTLFDDIVSKKMSITGGIGSDHQGERFSYPYDLPNSDTYNETCAAISLAMFADALQEMDADPRYGDVIERILFNGMLSGVSLSGNRFFYTNPLEIDMKKYDRSTYQPIPQRVEVFDCSCCPPNIVRTLASISRYACTVDAADVYCHQFIHGTTALEVDGAPASLTLEAAYPSDGRLTFSYSGKPMMLHVRIPSWCVEYSGEATNGYAVFRMNDGDTVSLELPMEVHFMQANPHVQDNAGRYAVTRGPLVYCMEGIDNGEDLRDIRLSENGTVRVEQEDAVPAPVLYMDAVRRKPGHDLYYLKDSEYQPFTARLIPYFSFANREATDMLVWTLVK